MVSTVALLTALAAVDWDGTQEVGPTSSGGNPAPGKSTNPFALPLIPGPSVTPDSTRIEPDSVEMEAATDVGLKFRTAQNLRDIAEPAEEPAPPTVDDRVNGAAAAWVSGTMQGYDWLKHVEQIIMARVMSTAEERNV
jgi:hypothetical protein